MSATFKMCVLVPQHHACAASSKQCCLVFIPGRAFPVRTATCRVHHRHAISSGPAESRPSLVDAVGQMKAKWAATWPCNTFVNQLVDYEAEVQGSAAATATATGACEKKDYNAIGGVTDEVANAEDKVTAAAEEYAMYLSGQREHGWKD